MGRFTSTPYLVLFVLLGAVGVSSAYAAITITLAGNVNVLGDITADSYQFTNPVEREIVYSELSARHSDNHLNTDERLGIAHTIPDNAKITDMECKFFDDVDTGRVVCRLLRAPTAGGFSQVFSLETANIFDGGDDTLSGNPNETVDRETFEYVLLYQKISCPSCVAKSIKLTYTVDEAD